MTLMLNEADTFIDPPAPDGRAAQLLRTTLRLNAFTSIVGGLLMAIAPGFVDELLGTASPGWIRAVGIGLIAFAVDVAILSRAGIRRLCALTPLVSLGDLGWVLASVATIAAGWYSARGTLVVAAVAVTVATFGIRQGLLVRRLRFVRVDSTG